jgi:hypothetical protein
LEFFTLCILARKTFWAVDVLLSHYDYGGCVDRGGCIIIPQFPAIIWELKLFLSFQVFWLVPSLGLKYLLYQHELNVLIRLYFMKCTFNNSILQLGVFQFVPDIMMHSL